MSLDNHNEERPKSESVSIHFGKTISKLDPCTEENEKGSKVWVDGKLYDLVVICDGGFSTLRKHVVMEGNGEPKYAGYVVWRGSVSVSELPNHILHDIEEGVYKNGIFDTIVLKMAKDNGEDLWTMGTFVATPEDEISMYWNKERDGKSRHKVQHTKKPPRSVPEWFLPHFETYFYDVPGLVPLVKYMMERGEITPHPQYEFGADRVHNGRILILGDAAHMASPRTAVGAHTAILDALALRQALATHPDDVDKAIQLYSESAVERAQELYARTRQISQQFLPPGGIDHVVSPSTILRTTTKRNDG